MKSGDFRIDNNVIIEVGGRGTRDSNKLPTKRMHTLPQTILIAPQHIRYPFGLSAFCTEVVYREEVWRIISKYSKKRDYSAVWGKIKVAIGN